MRRVIFTHEPSKLKVIVSKNLTLSLTSINYARITMHKTELQCNLAAVKDTCKVKRAKLRE